MATGYGTVVTCGSPVVKSSTGYGLTRLATGSLGTLGLIGEVTLKLWSQPLSVATIEVADAVSAVRELYRPLAVLETSEGSFAYLGGPEAQIEAQAGQLGAPRLRGLIWPEPISGPIQIEFRVPAAHLSTAIEIAQDIGAARWIGQHGVGIVSAALVAVGVDDLDEARTWAESVGGALVVVAGSGEGRDAWGSVPPSIEIQRRIKYAFDPCGICNPCILPGDL
jgi:FAD/FMN-containing dehydrogenase